MNTQFAFAGSNKQRLKRLLCYAIGVFEALLALFALVGLSAGLIFLVRLSIQPGVGAQRLVSVRVAGVAIVESTGAAIFGIWFGRLAIRNFRAAWAKAGAEEI